VSAASPAPIIRRRPTAAERNPVAHARRRAALETTLAILVPIGLIMLWEWQPWVADNLLVPPSDIVRHFDNAFASEPGGNMWLDVRASIKRILWGYLWGCVFGLLFGYVLGLSRLIRKALDPTLVALYMVPKLALIGVFLVILGFKDTPLIVVIAVTVFFFVYLQTVSAVRGVAENFREAGRSLGAGRWQMFRHVILPASLPQVFVGLRISAGVAVLTVIGAEFAYSPGQKGLGYRINLGRSTFDPPPMYVAIVTTAIIGVIFTWLVTLVGRSLTRWARQGGTEATF
jgi:sulfonate transport system permease protein